MVFPNGLTYKRTVLHGCDEFEIVACEWNKESISPQHDHGWSQCVVMIQEGCFENRSEFGLKSEIQFFEAGQVIATPVGVEHEIRCVTETGKTLHVYLPRIQSNKTRTNFAPKTLAQLRENIDFELNAEPTKWSAVAKALSLITENSISTQSPFFMNQLFSGVFPETLAAEKVSSELRTTMATFEASPTLTTVELEIVEQLGALIGWAPGHRDGIGVPGGSAANFMAVHCARQKRVPEFRKFGSRGERFKIYCSKSAHYSLQKACLATGLGTDALVEIDIDSTGRMNPKVLREKINHDLKTGALPLMVCATAGTTVYGAFDPLPALADICQELGLWLHVDGAWGGPAIFSEQARSLVAGIERADSMTFDAHKLFGSNLTTSFFLTRHPGILLEANDVSGGDYIFHTDEVVQDRGRLSWQCGRGSDALSFWTLWKNNGTKGLGKFVDRLFAVRNDSVAWIKEQPRLELILDPAYLNVCVRVKPPAGEDHDGNWSKTVRERLKNDNVAFVNFAKDETGTFLRLILAHPKIELSHVVQILQRSLEVQ